MVDLRTNAGYPANRNLICTGTMVYMFYYVFIMFLVFFSSQMFTVHVMQLDLSHYARHFLISHSTFCQSPSVFDPLISGHFSGAQTSNVGEAKSPMISCRMTAKTASTVE